MSSILPAPFGAGARKNCDKRRYVLNHLGEIEYRTMACMQCTDKQAAFMAERQLRSSNEFRFPT